MIDWNIIYWTLFASCSLPFFELLIDLIRVVILFVREYFKFKAFNYRLINHDYVDNDLLDEALALSKIRMNIARKHLS